MLLLQGLALTTLLFFLSTYNVVTLWYLGGFYLVLLGLWLLADDGDIFIGFLWVIDLGVGLVFFIFILHYSTFLHQKSTVDKTSRELSFVLLASLFFLSYLFFLSQPLDATYSKGFSKTWFFFISWYDYYDFFYSFIVTDLNLLREIYFINNSFEFFLINFVLFYGIVSSILLSFFIKRVFNFLNLTQLTSASFLSRVNSFFIRTQNFIQQQSTTSGARVWTKRKTRNF
jgi:hypothetical protein